MGGGEHSPQSIPIHPHRIPSLLTHSHPSLSTPVPHQDFARYVASCGVELVLRWVLLEGVTDTDEQLTALADFAKSLRTFSYIELLPFHQLGKHKYEKLNREYTLAAEPSYDFGRAQGIRDRLILKMGVPARLMDNGTVSVEVPERFVEHEMP